MSILEVNTHTLLRCIHSRSQSITPRSCIPPSDSLAHKIMHLFVDVHSKLTLTCRDVSGRSQVALVIKQPHILQADNYAGKRHQLVLKVHGKLVVLFRL